MFERGKPLLELLDPLRKDVELGPLVECVAQVGDLMLDGCRGRHEPSANVALWTTTLTLPRAAKCPLNARSQR